MELVVLSFFIFMILIWGRSFGTKNKKMHVRLTSIAITADIVLVLYLAMIRDVLTKIDSKMSILLMIHIFLALSVVVAYLLAIFYGVQLGRGREEFRSKMKFIDKIILPTRFLVFVTILILKANA